MLELFSSFKKFRFEAGINVNHPLEFWDGQLTPLKDFKALVLKFIIKNFIKEIMTILPL